MPQTVYSYWNDEPTATVKCLRATQNDYYGQAYPLHSTGFPPPGWQNVGFNDSGWSAPVNPLGFHLTDGVGPYTAQALVPGYWPDVTSNVSPSYLEGALFRQVLTVPAGNLALFTFGLWFQHFVVDEFNSHNSFSFQLGNRDSLANANICCQLWINGNFATASAATNATFVIPGAPNTFALWFNKPLPRTCTDLSGCEDVLAWDVPAFAGWNFRLTYSSPVTSPPPVEGRAPVGPFIAGPGGQTGYADKGFHGPMAVQHAIGWDASSAAMVGQSQETLVATWGIDEFSGLVEPAPIPPSTGTEMGAVYHIHDVSSQTGASPEYLAQCFNAQWTTLEWVRVGLRPTPFVQPRYWPPGVIANLSLCADAFGLPGNTIATASVDLSTVQSTNGPVFFQFVPSVTISPNTNYWLVLHCTGPTTNSATGTFLNVGATGWQCNPGTQPVGTNPVVYGFPVQGYQALTGDAQGNWTTITVSQPIGGCTATTTPDPAAVLDFSIGGEGLMVALDHTTMSCPPNGMGTGGRRDPNADNYPSSRYLSGWSVDGPVASPTPGSTDPYARGFRTLGLAVDTTGSGILIGTYVNPATGRTSWGPIAASRTVGLSSWPWPDVAQPPNTTRSINGGRAVLQPNGTYVALLNVADVVGPTSYSWVGVQTIAGATAGPLTLLQPNLISQSYLVLDAINDAAGNTHLFFADMAQNGPGQASPGTPVYHAVLTSTGTLTTATSWDCFTTYGTGCTHPSTGGVIFPYVSLSGCFLAAVFDQTGSLVALQELPTVSGARTVPPTFSFTPGNVATLTYIGSTGYLFCQDGVGISVAKYVGGAWTALAPWTTDAASGQGALSANYITARGQIGVLYSNGGGNFFQWFPDNLSYGTFVPTGCAPQPCAGTRRGRSYGQLIG